MAFSPVAPAVNMGELKGRMSSPLKSYLVHSLSLRTNHAGGLGVFSVGQPWKGARCIFPLLVEKWWLCFLEAFLLTYSWNPKRVTSKEGSMQPSVSQPDTGFGKVRELEGGGTAQCSRWEKSWPKGRKDLKPKSTLWCAGPPSEKNTHQTPTYLFGLEEGTQCPGGCWNRELTPLDGLEELWKAGAGAGSEDDGRVPKARLWMLGPKSPFCRFAWDCLGWNCTLCLVWVVDGETYEKGSMTFLGSQTDLGLNSSPTTYDHWNLGRKIT